MVSRAERKAASDFPQLPPAPDDYPTFPDTSTWPVVFPTLPPSPDGGPRRPPQHVSKAAPPRIPADRLPNHVAIVMDGNGRWATQRGLRRTEGHKMGEAVVIDIACGAVELGIKWLSLYAFSTENWKRSAEEVRFLMGFNRDVVRRRREVLNEMGVRIRWVGSRPRLWRSVINELAIAEQLTRNNDVITINYCVNYGGRTEIAEAAREIAREAAAGRLNPERVNESTISRHLQRPDIPDVDLFLRTSGEQRASNFMLWQAAYAEYIFQDKLWPDYDRRDLWAACEEYASRNRRFGSA
ncbi:decaprenyl diphosphate synthase [Mycobacterium saskatchewanense]|uniref:Isoprenyl transferase n=1 Tax=Mycobacterium saskatchewanense TaxID=220927 RepID=A0AAJ3TW43_9MYCO|nr:decaprenyl diphosphate synthase [Mycobacterium saskatchewanense]ORW73081.1 UDP pyrophosphate synthase [Mycobacterium saskatchewanense]BBX62345.1 decaprenyl diphosphate synthase [Mycobacterium saskatchewanense]